MEGSQVLALYSFPCMYITVLTKHGAHTLHGPAVAWCWSQ